MRSVASAGDPGAGGKSAAILLDDADVESAVDELLVWLLFAAGQCCVAPSRILASRSRYNEVVDAVVSAMERVPFGDPNDPAVVVGPLATASQRDRVLAHYRQGVREGAKVALGGGQPAQFGTGWYVEKTVFRDVDNAMTIAQEEIFGPACSITPTPTSRTPFASPMIRDSAWQAASGRATSTPATGWPADCGPAASGSTITVSTAPPHCRLP